MLPAEGKKANRDKEQCRDRIERARRYYIHKSKENMNAASETSGNAAIKKKLGYNLGETRVRMKSLSTTASKIRTGAG